MKHGPIEQIREIVTYKTLIRTIGIRSPDLQLVHHIIENLHRWLEHEEAGVENARVDEDRAELTTLEELIGLAKE